MNMYCCKCGKELNEKTAFCMISKNSPTGGLRKLEEDYWCCKECHQLWETFWRIHGFKLERKLKDFNKTWTCLFFDYFLNNNPSSRGITNKTAKDTLKLK